MRCLHLPLLRRDLDNHDCTTIDRTIVMTFIPSPASKT
jgi:hypothetical protein